MNTNSKFDAPLRLQAGVTLDHRVLNLDCTTHSFDDAPKFYESAIASPLHNATVVDGNCRVNQVASKGTQPCQGAPLVRSGQPAEANDIGRKPRCKLSCLGHASASRHGTTEYLRAASARQVPQ